MEILTFAQLHDALHSLGAFADTLSGFMDAAVQAPAPAPVDPAFAVPLTAPDGSPAEAMTSGKAGEVIEVKTLISHEMETGLRRDSAGKTVPRKIIKK